MLDIQTLLGDFGIPFWTSGKNVSHGWTTITCPLCDDRSNHGGFSPTGYGYTCFKCGKHSIYSVLSQVITEKNLSAIINQYSNDLFVAKKLNRERAAKVIWPPENAVKMPSIHAEYLHKRGFNPKQIRELFDIKFCYQIGKFKYRIIIPIYQNRRLVTYVGRDVTGLSKLPYMNLAERLSVLPAKECIYNLDNVSKVAIITEGIFDSWRFGVHGVSPLGIQFTTMQTGLLASRLDKAFVFFDNEPQAQQKALELGEILAFQGVSVENIVHTDFNDPGEMTQEIADEIKYGLL